MWAENSAYAELGRIATFDTNGEHPVYDAVTGKVAGSSNGDIVAAARRRHGCTSIPKPARCRYRPS